MQRTTDRGKSACNAFIIYSPAAKCNRDNIGAAGTCAGNMVSNQVARNISSDTTSATLAHRHGAGAFHTFTMTS